MVLVGTAEKKGKETTGTTKESDVTSRNLRKNGPAIQALRREQCES
jgi:hypothetical protein